MSDHPSARMVSTEPTPEQARLAERVRELVRQASGDAVADACEIGAFAGDAWIRVPRDGFRELARTMRSDSELAFEMLLDVTFVHFPRRAQPLGEFDAVYHFTSLSRGHRLRVKVAVPDAARGVESLVPVWEGANFMEREAYDMFGVRFEGHPDLRRILMPETYDGWPMRKDFPYRGH